MAAKVTIGVDATQLNAGMAAATNTVRRFATDSQSSVDKLGASVKSAFAFAGGIAAVHQLGFAVKGLLSDFDDIADAATKLGTTAESFQRIKLQAELAGASADSLTTALLKMEAGLARGGPEAEKLSKALESLGINTLAFTAAAPEQKIAMLASAFQQARAEGKGLSEIQDLFKKQFTELIPLLSTSGAELAKLAQHKVVSNEDVAMLAAANDSLDAMMNSVKVIAGTSLATLMKDFTFIDEKVKALTSGLAGLKDVIEFVINPQAVGIKKVRGMFGGEPATPPATSNAGTAEAATTPPTFSGTIPGLEAATGFPAASGIPGLSAAAPQRASAERTAAGEKAAVGQGKFAKEQLDALKRNNEILEKLIAQ